MDKNEHLAREKTEQAVKALYRAENALGDALQLLVEAADLTTTPKGESTIRCLKTAFGTMQNNLENGEQYAYHVISQWPIPPLPPLDLSNVPDIQFYRSETDTFQTEPPF